MSGRQEGPSPTAGPEVEPVREGPEGHRGLVQPVPAQAKWQRVRNRKAWRMERSLIDRCPGQGGQGRPGWGFQKMGEGS